MAAALAAGGAIGFGTTQARSRAGEVEVEAFVAALGEALGSSVATRATAAFWEAVYESGPACEAAFRERFTTAAGRRPTTRSELCGFLRREAVCMLPAEVGALPFPVCTVWTVFRQGGPDHLRMPWV